MLEINKLHCIDVLEGLRKLDDKSVQLVVSSPPYNRAYRSDNKKYMDYHDWREEDDFIEWQVEIFSQIERVLKDDGVVLWNFMYGNKTEDLPYKLALALQRSGLKLYETIMWEKFNAIPLTSGNHLSRHFEFIWLYAKNDKYFMNKDKITNGLLRKYFPMGYFSNVWQFGIHLENQFSLMKFGDSDDYHHAVFPIHLPKIGITLYSKEGDLVLDPFMGTGTTAFVAKTLGRKYIGFDLEQKYINIANKRIGFKSLEEF